MFNPTNSKHTGTVRDDQGHKLAIDGLWALMAGDATSGGVGTCCSQPDRMRKRTACTAC